MSSPEEKRLLSAHQNTRRENCGGRRRSCGGLETTTPGLGVVGSRLGGGAPLRLARRRERPSAPRAESPRSRELGGRADGGLVCVFFSKKYSGTLVGLGLVCRANGIPVQPIGAPKRSELAEGRFRWCKEDRQKASRNNAMVRAS